MTVAWNKTFLFVADELVFDKAERQPQMLDKELLKNWEKIDGLPDDDKLAVKRSSPRS